MSQITEEILEKLKTLTLIEAVELASQIETTFGVSAHVPNGGVIPVSGASGITSETKAESEKTTFDVILESVDGDKRVAVLKAVRALTNLGLKEAKDFCSSLPRTVKEGISKEEAEIVKKDLEGAGSKVTIKLIYLHLQI
jgi:large subunit ribosomal protein L7/L12